MSPSYGHLPDLKRNVAAFAAYSAPSTHLLPNIVDLRPHMPVVRNQGHLSSCTAYSITASYMYLCNRRGESFFLASPLFVYYVERAIRASKRSLSSLLHSPFELRTSPCKDSGAMISTSVAAIMLAGVPSLSIYSGDYCTPPSSLAWEEASKRRALFAYPILEKHPLHAIKHALSSGYCVNFAMHIYASYERTPLTGFVTPKSGKSMGFHALVLCGYDETHFTLQNSWGSGWGDKGYANIPYQSLLDLGSEFWVVTDVEVPSKRMQDCADVEVPSKRMQDCARPEVVVAVLLSILTAVLLLVGGTTSAQYTPRSA